MNDNSNHQTWKELKLVSKSLINTRFKDIYYVSQTGSTNSDLLFQANQGAKEGLVLVAGHQNTGRGRLDRLWEAPPQTNLLFSALIQPKILPQSLQLVTPALALSLVNVLAGHNIKGEIKWPNDVWLSGKYRGKIAGILAELVKVADLSQTVVVGMGCNVAWPTSKDELPFQATSLKEAGLVIDPEVLLIAVLLEFESQIKRLESLNGSELLRQDLLEKSATIGKKVLVQQHSGNIEGQALDLDVSGALIVHDGIKEQSVFVGDVVHLHEL